MDTEVIDAPPQPGSIEAKATELWKNAGGDMSPEDEGSKPVVETKPAVTEQTAAEKLRDATGKFTSEQKADDVLLSGELPQGVKVPTAVLFKQQAEKANERIKERETRLQALQAEMEELRGKVVDTTPFQEEAKAARERAEKLERELKAAAYERSDDFKTKFVNEEKRVETSLSEVLKEAGADETLSRALLTMSGKRQGEMIENLDIEQWAKNKIYVKIEAFERIQSEKSEAISNAAALYEQQTAAERAKSEAYQSRRLAEEKRAFDSQWTAMQKSLPTLQPVEGSDAHVTRAEQVRTAAERILLSNENTIEQHSAAAIKAAEYDFLLEKHNELAKELALFKSENSRLLGATPGMGNDGQRSVSNGTTDLSKMTTEERARHIWNSGG